MQALHCRCQVNPITNEQPPKHAVSDSEKHQHCLVSWQRGSIPRRGGPKQRVCPTVQQLEAAPALPWRRNSGDPQGSGCRQLPALLPRHCSANKMTPHAQEFLFDTCCAHRELCPWHCSDEQRWDCLQRGQLTLQWHTPIKGWEGEH